MMIPEEYPSPHEPNDPLCDKDGCTRPIQGLTEVELDWGPYAEWPDDLIFDSTLCSVSGCNRPVGGSLVEDPDTGYERGRSHVTYRTADGAYICEDCAGLCPLHRDDYDAEAPPVAL